MSSTFTKTAKTATKFSHVQITVHPSRSQLNKRHRKVLSQFKQRDHLEWVARAFPSAQWYKRTTVYQPHCVSKFTKRPLGTIIHCLRRGYKCNWYIIDQEERDCMLCKDSTTAPLLLECIISVPLKNMTNTPTPAFSIGTAMVPRIVENIAVTQDFLLTFTPFR